MDSAKIYRLNANVYTLVLSFLVISALAEAASHGRQLFLVSTFEVRSVRPL